MVNEMLTAGVNRVGEGGVSGPHDTPGRLEAPWLSGSSVRFAKQARFTTPLDEKKNTGTDDCQNDGDAQHGKPDTKASSSGA